MVTASLCIAQGEVIRPSPPLVTDTYDTHDYHVIDVTIVGEKSCFAILGETGVVSRCFDASSIMISDTIELPDNAVSGRRFATRISVGNGKIECLVITELLTGGGSVWVSCSNDVNSSG